MGNAKAVIYDLKNERLISIPIFLYKLIKQLENQSVEEIRSLFSDADKTVLDKYLQFLKEKRVGVFAEERFRFDPLNLDWFSPCTIAIAVIELDFKIDNNPASLIRQLDQLHCKALELRVSDIYKHRHSFEEILNVANQSSISEMLLFLYYENGMDEGWFRDLKNHLRVYSKIYVLNCPLGIHFDDEIVTALSSQSLETLCIGEDTEYIVNMLFFMESQHYHPYFNKRICINKKGEVKNCLSHERSFGNAHWESLARIINETEFKMLWYAKPDLIEDIKDSELRYAIYSNHDLIRSVEGYYKYK